MTGLCSEPAFAVFLRSLPFLSHFTMFIRYLAAATVSRSPLLPAECGTIGLQREAQDLHYPYRVATFLSLVEEGALKRCVRCRARARNCFAR